MDQQYFYELVDRYLGGTATEAERRVVEGYYDQLSLEAAAPLSDARKAALKEEIYRSIRERVGTPAKVVPLRRWRVRIAAAAVLIVLAGAGYWLGQGGKGPEGLAHSSQAQRFKNDIRPAHQGATLTLAGGRLIRLDSAGNGAIASQGKTLVVKRDTALSYIGKPQNGTILYNTVSTGKGEEYHIELADGTRVWLDALSSIHFPTAFTGSERVVEITGQAYFDVAKDAARPFRVRAGKQTVEVLGTGFDINAYGPVPVTTLLSGSVRIRAGSAAQVLQPGEQATAGDGGIRLVAHADLEEVMAWKNGRFGFNGASVEEIMTQLSRWYDIDVVYHDKIPEKFVARISRDEPLSGVLSLLEMTKEIAFTIEGKKITVYNLKDKQ